MAATRELSRRELFGRLFSPLRGGEGAAPAAVPAAGPVSASESASAERERRGAGPSMEARAGRVATISMAACLAYRGLACTVCAERCPVAGALVLEGGVPRIDPSLCDGCMLCREVCPAPGGAIASAPVRRPAARTPAAAPANGAPRSVFPALPPGSARRARWEDAP